MRAGWSSKNNQLEMGEALPDALGMADFPDSGSERFRALIDQCGVGEAEVFGFTDDDVVEDADTEDFARFGDARGAIAILAVAGGETRPECLETFPPVGEPHAIGARA